MSISWDIFNTTLGASVGAGLGFAATSALTDGDKTKGLAVGAGIGAGVGLLTPKVLPSAAIGTAKFAKWAGPPVGKFLGKVGLGAMQVTGSAVLGAGKTALKSNGPFKSGVLPFMSSLVKFDEDAFSLGKRSGSKGVSLTGLGKTTLIGSSLMAGAASAFNEFNKIKMGQMDSMISAPAPQIPMYDQQYSGGSSRNSSYVNNAGATGDLVFALNKNRRG